MKIEFQYIIGIAFISVFVIVHLILKSKRIEYNKDNIAIALLLGFFIGVLLVLFLQIFINPVLSLIITSIILAFVYGKILLSWLTIAGIRGGFYEYDCFFDFGICYI